MSTNIGKPKPKTKTRKPRNITVDAEVQELVSRQQDKLEGVFGFRPTISQTLRYMLKNTGDKA